MTIQKIIAKWDREKNRLIEEMQFCEKHNFTHEKDYIYQRYNAISDVLLDLKYDLED